MNVCQQLFGVDVFYLFVWGQDVGQLWFYYLVDIMVVEFGDCYIIGDFQFQMLVFECCVDCEVIVGVENVVELWIFVVCLVYQFNF